MAAAQPKQTLTHLNLHSHYSLLGATPKLDDALALAAAQGMGALALTDSNALYGAVAFARSCVQAGIQPITGMTVTVAAPEELSASDWATPAEIVLLASGREGWSSLCGLSSAIQARP